MIRSDTFYIQGNFKRASENSSLSRFFAANDPVFELHFHALDGDRMVFLLRRLKDQFLSMKEHGIKGLFTDTPNPVITKYLLTRMGGVELPISEQEQREAMLAYKSNKQYPREYLKLPVKRTAIKF